MTVRLRLDPDEVVYKNNIIFFPINNIITFELPTHKQKREHEKSKNYPYKSRFSFHALFVLSDNWA